MIERVERPRRDFGEIMAWLGLMGLVALGQGCRGDDVRSDGGLSLDASTDLVRLDGGTGEVAEIPLLDFVVQGCENRTASQCLGPAPLELTFVPVAPGKDVSASWDLGDGSAPVQDLIVTHVFAKPGIYTVTLTVNRHGDTLSERKLDLVLVGAPRLGDPCGAVGSCEIGTCTCDAETCGPALAGGICVLPCDALTPCPEGSSTQCVDLRGSPSGLPWRQMQCLPRCAGDSECRRQGFVCRAARAAAGGWTNVCLPPDPLPLASPCRDENGALSAERCIGGVCLDIGASGYCSATCASSEDCPSDADCARFGGDVGAEASAVCLKRCQSGPLSCAMDALLACELPDPSGALGFTLSAGTSSHAAGYCAPRRCATRPCEIGARCDVAAGQFCVPSVP